MFYYCATLLFFRRPEAYDSGMLADSGLLHQLHHSWDDPCASWRSGISFTGATSRAVQKCCFDASDASIQPLNESRYNCGGIAFQRHSKLFKFTDYGLSSLGGMYLVCAILRSALTCLYGNTTSEISYGASNITTVLYLNVFRNMFTLTISKKQISENSCLNSQNYTSACKVK